MACLAVAQVLLRFDDERHWLRAAAERVGQLFPRLPGQAGYKERLKALAPLMEAALRWLAEATPGSAEMLRLWTARPCRAGSPSSPRSEVTWPGTPATPTAPRTPGSTGARS